MIPVDNNTRMNVGYYPQKTKRNRTCFKHHQLRLMKEYFKKNRNPDSKDLKQLGKETLLSKRVLQVSLKHQDIKKSEKYRMSVFRFGFKMLELSIDELTRKMKMTKIKADQILMSSNLKIQLAKKR